MNKMSKRCGIRLGVVFSAVTLANVVAAPVLAQQGFKSGNYFVLPSIEVEGHYSDNIYLTDTDTDSSKILQIQPKVQMLSDFDKNALNFSAGGDIGLYSKDGSSNDFIDANVSADGRLDYSGGLNVFGGIAGNQSHEVRGSRNNETANEPVKYRVGTASVGVSKNAGKFSFRLDGKMDDYTFSDQSRDGTTDTSLSHRDRREYFSTVRLGYTVNPSTQIYVSGGPNIRDYDDNTDNNGLKRSSDGYEAVVGLAFGVPGLFSGDFKVGAMRQNYDEATYDNVSRIKFGWSLEYVPTPNVAIRSTGSNSLSETTTANASTLLSTSYGLGARVDVTRDLFISPDLSYTRARTIGTGQVDRTLTAGIGATYSVTSVWYATADYKRARKDSNVDTSDYRNSITSVRIGAEF